MDNASFHRKSKLNLLAEKYGHKIIFLPPYSPKLNDLDSLDDVISGCFQVN